MTMPTEPFIQFDAPCQRCTPNDRYFALMFNPGEGELPSAMFFIPKEYPPCERGKKYRITIEPAPAG